MNTSNFSVEKSLNAGRYYLQGAQDDDGLWHDFMTMAGESCDWVSGYVAAEVLSCVPEPHLVVKTRDALWARQRPDGGWGYSSLVPPDADTTAHILLFLLRWLEDNEAVHRAADFLLGHQCGGGFRTFKGQSGIREFINAPSGYSIEGWCAPHVEVTAAVGRALLLLGREYGPQAEGAREFVCRTQNEDGSWPSYWWSSPYYSTYQAAMLISEMPSRCDWLSSLSRAIAWTKSHQDPDGSWRSPVTGQTSALDTALAIKMISLEKKRCDGLLRGVMKLMQLQDEDGSWASEPSLRIPAPDTLDASNVAYAWCADGVGAGSIVRDQNRLFTTATCIAALGSAASTTTSLAWT